MRYTVLTLLAVGLTVAPSLAGERIHLKNGRIVEVQSTRVEGPMLFLTLTDGAEMGIPQVLVENVEAGITPSQSAPVTNYSGRGPNLSQLQGYQALQAQLGQAGRSLGPAVTGIKSGGKRGAKAIGTFGFSQNGSLDLADIKQESEKVSVRQIPTVASAVAPWGEPSVAPSADNPNRFKAEQIVAGPPAQ